MAMMQYWVGYFALVSFALGLVMMVGGALVAYVMLRGKRKPARGFEVVAGDVEARDDPGGVEDGKRAGVINARPR
jgi:hypothetical protein